MINKKKEKSYEMIKKKLFQVICDNSLSLNPNNLKVLFLQVLFFLQVQVKQTKRTLKR